MCGNPHDLMRTHEVLDILDVSRLILNACMLRRSSSKPLCFIRGDYPEMDPETDRRFITIRKEGDRVIREDVPLDYYGDIETEYLARNADYLDKLERGEAHAWKTS
jgi:succinate dehydrogenase/fumarate reductase flavoprotein subunit